MDKHWFLVNTPKKLQRAIDDFSKSTILSIDTEYDSFRYFREVLCLIQIKAHDATYIFDPLDKLDISFLGKYFADRKIIKVLHAADNDIRLLRRDYGFEFKNIFDTHRAAHILGFQQLSLEKMINEFLDVELKKSKKMQRSRWDTRPLSDEQLLYAVEDVKYLSALCTRQLAQLRENDLEAKAEEAFAKIAASNWQEKKLDRRGYAKIAGYYSLTQLQKELLKKLYAWRFQRAKDENRAIFMFMPDNILLDIVLSGETFRNVLPHEKAKVYGPELEKIISEHSY